MVEKPAHVVGTCAAAFAVASPKRSREAVERLKGFAERNGLHVDTVVVHEDRGQAVRMLFEEHERFQERVRPKDRRCLTHVVVPSIADLGSTASEFSLTFARISERFHVVSASGDVDSRTEVWSFIRDLCRLFARVERIGRRTSRSGRPKVVDAEEAAALSREGYTLREIGERLGVSHEAVRKALGRQPSPGGVFVETVVTPSTIEATRSGRTRFRQQAPSYVEHHPPATPRKARAKAKRATT